MCVWERNIIANRYIKKFLVIEKKKKKKVCYGYDVVHTHVSP